jgi:hypothetical protein
LAPLIFFFLSPPLHSAAHRQHRGELLFPVALLVLQSSYEHRLRLHLYSRSIVFVFIFFNLHDNHNMFSGTHYFGSVHSILLMLLFLEKHQLK